LQLRKESVGIRPAAPAKLNARRPSEFPLTLMQQVAVNEGLRRVSSGGMFSINGPPGTGKTTLLADVVAAVVVERARLMTEFSAPAAAFRDAGTSMADDDTPDARLQREAEVDEIVTAWTRQRTRRWRS
jgi:hypothetical protein